MAIQNPVTFLYSYIGELLFPHYSQFTFQLQQRVSIGLCFVCNRRYFFFVNEPNPMRAAISGSASSRSANIWVISTTRKLEVYPFLFPSS